MKTKIKSYSFWTSLSAAIVLLINSLGSAFGFEIEEKLISNIVMSICGLLVVLGVVNMPTEKKKKTDTIDEKVEINIDKVDKV